MKNVQSNISIPRIGYKSSFLIALSTLLGSVVIPLMLKKVGITWTFIHVLISGLFPAFTTSYCIYFIESDKGYSKKFWQVFIALFAIISFISYFWMYNILMI